MTITPGDGWWNDDSFRVVLRQRNFSGEVSLGADVHVQAMRYAWDCVGGPSWATLRVVGPSPAVWEAAECLRCPVEIYSSLGELVWWGYVNSLSAGAGAVTLGVGLDDMANRVAARYPVVSPGRSAVTDWNWNADSEGEFGVKERILPSAGYDANYAAGARDVELVRAGLPPISVSAAGFGAVQRIAGTVMLHCQGWFNTLSWRYYAQPAGLVEWTATNQVQDFGQPGGGVLEGWGQKFSYAGDSWTMTSIDVRLAKVGAPGDGVWVSLNADAGGVPGAELAIWWLAASNLTQEAAWVSGVLSVAVTISTGTYWVLVRRSGLLDAVNYYRVWVDANEGFAAGGQAWVLWGFWQLWGPLPVHLGFRVHGVQEHADQVSVIVANVAQYLTGTEIVGGSGVSSCQFRDGVKDAGREVKALLGSGSVGRLLANVRSDRCLELRPAPLVTGGVQYWLNADGSVVDAWERVLPAGECLAGVWVGLGDMIPGNADVSHYGRVSPFWVEGSVYEVGSRRLRLLGLGAVGLSRDDAAMAAGDVAL